MLEIIVNLKGYELSAQRGGSNDLYLYRRESEFYLCTYYQNMYIKNFCIDPGGTVE